MIKRFVLSLAASLLLAAPALAAESCQQALTDTTNASKTAMIGPKETEKVNDLLKQATDLCKGDDQQQAEGRELLRVARTIIGES
jgi:hypothetical protein